MAEMNVPSGPKYRLKKINDMWFLENSHTRTTKRVPFLSRKVHIMLEDNIIFADDNQYAIRVTEDGKDKIEKVTDLDNVEPDEVNENRAAEEGSTRTDTVPNLEELASDEVDDIVTSTQGGSTRSQQPVTSRQAATYDEPNVPDYVPFRVSLENTPLAKLCGLSGNMELRVEKSAISFYETNTQRTKQSLGYRFQYNWIRRYGNIGRDVFTIEVGRRCPNGEGEIRFKTAGDAAKIRETLFSKTNM